MSSDHDPYVLFYFVFILSGIAGLAALLRTANPINPRQWLSSFLNSGLFGVGLTLLWYHYYGENHKHSPVFIIGVSLLAGLGGVSLLDFFFAAVKNGLETYVQRVANSFPTLGAKQDETKGP